MTLNVNHPMILTRHGSLEGLGRGYTTIRRTVQKTYSAERPPFTLEAPISHASRSPWFHLAENRSRRWSCGYQELGVWKTSLCVE